MFSSPVNIRKRIERMKKVHEDNNNTDSKFTEIQQARTFITWYKHMIDNERQNLPLYFSDDSVLEWFGRTIKTRKKVSTFIKYDMQCTRHDFTSVENIDKIETRQECLQRMQDSVLARPLHSPELVNRADRPRKRLLRSNCNSPEWAPGCDPNNDLQNTESKRMKIIGDEQVNDESKEVAPVNNAAISNNGDGISAKRLRRKCITVTPPNREIGQGDCIPSTSGTDSDKSHDALNAQLPRLAVECNGYIEFTRMRNNRNIDSMKWERKCKVQISYSEDPLNVGEYIIWALRYTDESKCRRNLLSAFEEVSKEEEMKRS